MELPAELQVVLWDGWRGTAVGTDAGQETQEKEGKGKRLQNQQDI